MSNNLSNLNTEGLFREQLLVWKQAADNYNALKGVKTKMVEVNGFPFKVQFNPARIISSAAKVDSKSIQERKCFLCKENRPAVQKGLEWCSSYQSDCDQNPYTILVNPFPIFPLHLTIPLVKHQDQLIKGRIGDMLDLSESLPEYTIFYNGPKCGASAPDHFHFQAGNKGFLPIETKISSIEKGVIFSDDSLAVYTMKSGINGVIGIESINKDKIIKSFDVIFNQLPVNDGETEPMLNILSWFDNGKWYLLLFLRIKHRPSHYFAEGSDNILLSPASVDLGGVLITPLEKDFEKITSAQIKEILEEVLLSFDDLENFANKLNFNRIL